MRRLAAGIVLILLISMTVVGCSSQRSSLKPPDEPPEITITIGDREIEYIAAKNEWNGAEYDREDTFRTILAPDSDIEVPYIIIGEIAEVSFENNPPEDFYILDMIINKDGSRMYDNRVTEEIPVELKDGKCSFEIKKNMASLLSSYYEPNKKDLRGIRMIASWGENECEYAFVIKTDAY
ncbi:MAG: hypothetical protein K0R84_2853 [Clostridia bacterium]|jgi:hypothetical protein|nr:hypothetical protein [Clostridia bacterium]